MSKNRKYDDLILAIKEDEKKAEEQKKSDATLEQIREEHALFQGLLKAMREAREECAAVAEVLQAAKDSADNAIGGICAAIVKAENTSIKARLDDESFRLLDRLHAQWLEQEKQGAWRPVQAAGGVVAEAGYQVGKHYEEQRGSMDL